MSWFEIYAIIGAPTLMLLAGLGVAWMAIHYP